MLDRHGRVAAEDVQAIRAALEAATCTASESQARTRELLQTYRLRAAPLARFDSDHARALRSETERLCERLANAGDVWCRLWSFELAHGRDVLFFEDADSGELYGIIHAVHAGKVTAEEWAALWGTDPEAERAWRAQMASLVRPP